MLSTVSSSKSPAFDKKFRNFELNRMKNLEKKFNFCDRPVIQAELNDNGKQITVHLNTVAYEILKNHALPLLSSFGTVSLINPSVVTADLDNSTIEAQLLARLWMP